MVPDDETRRWLNLLRSSPTFVFAIGDGAPAVKALSVIPANSGLYWVAGTSILPGGRELESVFVVDSGAGGELTQVFWFVESEWFASTETAGVFERTGLTREEVFPFDWRLAVPLEDDKYHPGS